MALVNDGLAVLIALLALSPIIPSIYAKSSKDFLYEEMDILQHEFIHLVESNGNNEINTQQLTYDLQEILLKRLEKFREYFKISPYTVEDGFTLYCDPDQVDALEEEFKPFVARLLSFGFLKPITEEQHRALANYYRNKAIDNAPIAELTGTDTKYGYLMRTKFDMTMSNIISELYQGLLSCDDLSALTI